MTSQDTLQQHAELLKRAQQQFQTKAGLYGDSWKIMDVHYIANRIMVKCERIMQLLTHNVQQVEDDIPTELMDIINYALIALMQLQRQQTPDNEAASPQANIALYQACVEEVTDIFKKKNHDYNDAWRKMQYTSLITQIKVKLSRVLHTPLTAMTTHHASVHDQYADIVNYAIFASLHPEAPTHTTA